MIDNRCGVYGLTKQRVATRLLTKSNRLFSSANENDRLDFVNNRLVEHFKYARGGVFQPNNCLQPRRDTPLSVKRLRLCLTLLEVYVCNRDHAPQHACMLCIYDVELNA